MMRIFSAKTSYKILNSIIAAMLAMMVTLPAAYADDTEIFFGKSGSGEDFNPNILFMLDTSLSMRVRDGFPDTRLQRMQSAMDAILDQSSDFNVGLMGLNGENGGGPILYPIGHLEKDTSIDCPASGCPDQLVIGRMAQNTDDAIEQANDGWSRFNRVDTTLGLRVPSNGALEDIENDESTTTKSTAATASVLQAYRTLDGFDINRENELSDLWFYWGSGADFEATQYAYRFDNVEIPIGATVTDAKITFVVDGPSKQIGDVGAYLSAESSATPAPYPDASTLPYPDVYPQLSERLMSNELVAWEDIPQGTEKELIDTPDLSALLQEVISLPGWLSGNSMSIHVDPFDTVEPDETTTRQFYGVSAEANLVPTLTYSYIENDTETNSGIALTKASEHILEHIDGSSGATTATNSGSSVSLFTLDDKHELGTLGLRFDDLAIPKNATITSARLRMHITNSQGGAPAGLVDILLCAISNTCVDGSNPSEVSEEATFDISINAQISHDPQAFGTVTLRDLANRDFSANFVDWIDVPAVNNEKVESPELRDLIQDVVNVPDWDISSPLLLTLDARDGIGADLQRTIESSQGNETNKPELEISWTVNGEIEAGDAEQVITGLRFQNVHVPPGATITNAYLRVNSAEASTVPTTLTITAENTGNSAEFTNDYYGISSRDTTVSTTWPLDEWPQVGVNHDSTDVSQLVQQVVSRNDWCGGNALTMILSGDGHRRINSFDGDSANAPRLYIEYDPDTVSEGSYCSNGSFIGTLGDEDDVFQATDGGMTLGGAALPSTGSVGGQVGLRFPNIAIAPGTQLRTAALQITTAMDTTNGATFTIEIEDTNDAIEYKNGNANLSNRSYLGESVTWDDIPVSASGELIFSPDLTTLVSSVINSDDWQELNAMAFRLTQTSGETVSFYSNEGDPGLSARLLLYFESTRETPGTLVRDNLKAIVDDIVLTYATPLPGTLYEASLYFGGAAVDYGLERGSNRRVNRRRYRRVSHPGSYTGDSVVTRRPNCTDDNLNHVHCSTEKIEGGSAVYKSPILNACQGNHVVLLTDGQSWKDGSASKIQNRLGIDSCVLPNDDYSACGTELADWMWDTDMSSSLAGKQNVSTHTIAFNLKDNAWLEEMAANGRGKSYSANSSSELLNVFKSIFQSVSATSTSFVAPSVSVDQFNRLKHSEDILFAQFKPSSTARWEGNLKKYRIQGNEDEAITIMDAREPPQPAIDEVTAQFKPDSRSFWSNEADGGVVTKGGAASRLHEQTRNIYTITGTNKLLTDFENRVDFGNTALDIALFDLPPNLLTDTDYHAALINWTAGYDSLDEDADEDVTEYRNHMGDLMHSQPIVVDYTSGAGTKSIIFAGTNEGYLHAIDNLTGLEQYAFIPPELLPNMRLFFDNDRQARKTYGVDGPISTWLSDENNNGRVDTGETALLYFGLRRGGDSYYALDISDVDSPKLAFIIEGGLDINNDPLIAVGDYTELSETWSRINKTKLRHGDEEIDVIVFAGGYDSNQDPGSTAGTENPATGDFGVDGTRSTDGNGRAIYIANAETGDLIWKTSANTMFSQMDYSIPGDLSIVDINGDGLVDQLYFGDMGGQIWRMDINNTEENLQLEARITAGVIAEFGSTTDANRGLRFYYPPDVALIEVAGKLELSISIGSGWRAHPLQTYIDDRFYSFRMDAVFNAPRDSFDRIFYPTVTEDSNDLVNVTDTLGSDMAGKKGWYIDLEGNGEKALSSSLTLDNKIIFTTYTPSTIDNGCSADVGRGAAYVVDVFNGDPVLDSSDTNDNTDGSNLNKNDRKQYLENPGIPVSPNLILPPEGKPSVQIGPESLDGFSLDDLKRRSFWQEHIDDNS